MSEEDILEGYPLADSIDHEILMHRDAHFGGHFPTMIEYYKNEGKGVQPDFSILRIEKLADLEKQMGTNLAVIYLTGNEAEKVASVKEAYKQLKKIYEVNNPKNRLPQLIADLILTEDIAGTLEIEPIVKEQGKIVPSLINLLQSEDFYDPLFPGYGFAPSLAVKCLELIGDKRAIIALFENLGHGDFFEDDQIIKALKSIGEPAKEFLLKVVEGRPLNEDNEKAAIALIAFKDYKEVGETCLRLLQSLDVQKDPCLPTYLVLDCEGLSGDKQKEFIELSKNEKLTSFIRQDMQVVIKSWQEHDQKS